MGKVFFALAFLVLFFSACSGSPDTDELSILDNDSDDGGFNASGDFDVNPTPKEVSKEKNFLDVATKKQAQTVEYVIESNHPDEISSGFITVYKDGSTIRKDLKSERDETRILKKGSAITSCYRIDSHWACDEEGAIHELIFETTLERIIATPKTFTIVSTPARTIAGSLAQCFKITKEGFEAIYCLDQTGIITYSNIKEGGYTSVYQALSFSATIEEGSLAVP